MKHKLGICALMILIAFLVGITPLALAYPPLTNDWPKFHGNLENTGVAYSTLYGIPTPQLLWSYTTDNTMSPSSPSLADIDGDGNLEVVIGTANFANTGGIYVIKADGTLLWKYETGDYGTYASPAIDDLDGDGNPEIVFVSYAGKITVLNHDGTVKWLLDKGSAGTKAAIADVTGDGNLEVIAGAAGKTWLLQADGTEIWNKNFIIGTEPAFADLNGDGKLEIVFAAAGTKTVVALKADGSTLWTSPAAGDDFQLSLSIMNDVTGDGVPDVAVGCRDKKVYVYSGADGALWWSYLTVGRVFGIAVADLDGDGVDDVIATATKGDGVESYVYALYGRTGALMWSHNIVGRSAYTTEGIPSIADVDKDGVLDVVVGSTNSKLYALSGIDGSEIWTFDVAHPSPSAPAIADINPNTVLDIVIRTGNIVYCITGPAPPPPRPVGGVWVPIDTLKLLAPWIVLASLMAAAIAVGSWRLLKKRW